jgi:malate dehydrogenase (oxaloacetate-decarboxylating)(NADP+)
MCSLNPQPIIFPLSNPSSLCELEYQDAIRWSDGNVVFASGSPYSPVTFKDKTFEPGQGNNMYVFPGIGLGSILCEATTVTNSMIERAALELAASVSEEERNAGLIYPRLVRIREVSALIARGVIREAQKQVMVPSTF